MPILTLTSDWKNDDYYVGAVKGEIISRLPAATIIDISHRIDPFDIGQAAYIIRNAYRHYPPGTIHLLMVASTVASKRYLLVEANGHYFVGADNGIFGLIFDEGVQLRVVEVRPREVAGTFPELSMIVPAACQFAVSGQMEIVGNEIADFNQQIPLMAVIDRDMISGRIIFIDSYGNAISNVTQQLFRRIGQNRPFVLTVKSKHNEVTEISTCYSKVPAGDMFAVFNFSDLLEIGIANANAAQLLSIDRDTYIRIVFST